MVEDGQKRLDKKKKRKTRRRLKRRMMKTKKGPKRRVQVKRLELYQRQKEKGIRAISVCTLLRRFGWKARRLR